MPRATSSVLAAAAVLALLGCQAPRTAAFLVAPPSAASSSPWALTLSSRRVFAGWVVRDCARGRTGPEGYYLLLDAEGELK